MALGSSIQFVTSGATYSVPLQGATEADDAFDNCELELEGAGCNKLNRRIT
jgi:hypothetical protein